MDEEKNRTSLGAELLRAFAAAFSPAVLVMTFTGMLMARYAPEAGEISTLFAAGTGMSYNSILQIAGLALIFAVFIVLLFSQRFLTKMRFLYRILIFFSAAMVVVSIFAIIFKWFPANNIPSWIAFVLSFAVCYAGSTGLTLLWLKKEKKKYGRLLADYKERRKKPE